MAFHLASWPLTPDDIEREYDVIKCRKIWNLSQEVKILNYAR